MFIQSSGEAVKWSWNRPILEGNRTQLDAEAPLPLQRWWWWWNTEGKPAEKMERCLWSSSHRLQALIPGRAKQNSWGKYFPRGKGVRWGGADQNRKCYLYGSLEHPSLHPWALWQLNAPSHQNAKGPKEPEEWGRGSLAPELPPLRIPTPRSLLSSRQGWFSSFLHFLGDPESSWQENMRETTQGALSPPREWHLLPLPENLMGQPCGVSKSAVQVP